MSIKDKYHVATIDKKEAYPWLTKKHYAKKIPSVILYSFGCFKETTLIGVAIFGLAGNNNLNKIGGYPVIELTRLVLNDEKEKNVTSYFLSQSLKMLSHKGFVVSFSDPNYGHHGYIYQATNWIYTGESASSELYINGDIKLHSKTFSDKFGRRDKKFAKEKGYKIEKQKPKHRYFYILGDKKEQKKMMGVLVSDYKILPYPKGDNKRYDASFKPEIQLRLF